MRKKLNVSRYIFAAILTIAVFSIGILIGTSLDIKKIEYVRIRTEEQATDLESLQFQYLFLRELNETEACPVIEEVMQNNLRTLQPILGRLIEYEDQVGLKVSKRDYEQVKREYTLANFRYWLLARKSRELCQNDVVSILYFYTPECKICPDQGYILTNLRLSFPEGRLLIFPVDAGFTKEPAIGIFLKKYNITSYPTLIIEDKVVNEFVPREKLLDEICLLYTQQYEPCLRH